MKILITGARGQLGTDLIPILTFAEHTVIPTDVSAGLPSGWQRLDVTNARQVEEIFAQEQPDCVIHLAAILSATGEQDPNRTYDVNQQGTYHVLEACRKLDIKKVFFASSIAVYGPGLPTPTKESVALAPSTMYGVTKASGEMLCEYYRSRYGMDVRGIRFPGLVSATMPGGGSSDYALFMYVHGVQNGHYQAFCRPDTRIPLMYMKDGVSAVAQLLKAPKETLTRVCYNIAGFSPTAQQIADSVKRALPQVDLQFKVDPLRQAILDSWPDVLDDSLAKTDWQWQPRFTLDHMTDDLIPKVRTMLSNVRRHQTVGYP